MTDYRALCAELINHLQVRVSNEDREIPTVGYYSQSQQLLDRARAALAQPEPEAPTDEEIMEVFWEHQNGLEELWADDWPAAARAVLAKWGHQ
jgi:hypothetical protein